MKRTASSLAALVVAFGLAFAQEQQPPPGGTPIKPKFGPELARLSFMVGTFTTASMTYDTPMGKGGPGKGRTIDHWGLDSLYLLTAYEGTMPTMGRYEGHGVFTYDGPSQSYRCWWFDNFGSHSEYTGNFAGDTLVLETEFPMPQGNMKEKLMWHPEGKKVKFRMVWDMGQGPMPVMDETATPSGAATRRKK